MNVLMISGDVDVIKNIEGPFTLTLQELGKYWEKIDVICPGQLGRVRQLQNNIKLIGVRKFLLLFDLLILLKKNKYDLIIVHDYGLMLNGLSAFISTLFYPSKIICEIHHLEGYPIATSAKEYFYRQWGKIYIRFIAKYFVAIRVDNYGEIVTLLKKSGVKETKITYIPPIYLDLNKFKSQIAEKKIDFLYVGRLAQNKGIFTILEAVSLIKKMGKDPFVIIKGRGPLTDEIKKFILNHDLSKNIQLIQTNITESELAILYSQARCLICASTVEGGPRVTFEAMACNTPVITTACGLMPEVIRHGENGFIFNGTANDLSLKMNLILNLSELEYKKLQTNSRNSILGFDYKITLKNYAQAYLKLISNESL